MKNEILANLDHPKQLEKLYREDKQTFKKAFNGLYPEMQNSVVADYWFERLNFEGIDISRGTGKDLIFIIVASLIAGIIAKFPTFLPITEDFFYPRNIGFIVFPFLTAYFAWKNKLPIKATAVIGGAIFISLVFINSLPHVNANKSDTLILSCLHLLLFLWSVLGVAFVSNHLNNHEKRLSFLRFNGDLVVMTTLILIAGLILTGITIALFSLIGFQIEEFYFENVAVFGLAAAPLVGTYLTQINPLLVSKVSPTIAKIFSPLVLITLIIYLVAIIFSGKNPYNDREFLIIFNALLIGVMALIFFSVAENTRTTRNQLTIFILFLLSAITVLINGIALSAILFRISEWGITPNRAAVLGGNVLILANLLLVTVKLFQVLTWKGDILEVGKPIASFLPVYCLWTVVVTFLFPFLFGFK